MMEDELRKAGLLPSASTPTVDLEAFLEQHLRVTLDQHADLPADVLGLTEFNPGKSPHVAINRDLTGSAIDDDGATPGLVGRWRATLAHEATHALIHRALFELGQGQAQLFGDGSSARQEPQRLMRCYKKDILYRSGGNDWREIQANQGMAALLMPRSIFIEVVEKARSGAAPILAGTADLKRLVADLASRFTVSKQAAEIRLSTLGVLVPAGQKVLGG
jgi:hypothetical protein